MSDTPRTDANDWITQVASVNLAGQDCVEEERVVDADFARQLERELAVAWMVKDDLLAELAKVRQQRDEARRLYCVEMSRQSSDPKRFTPEWGANELGWDCFAKEGGGA